MIEQESAINTYTVPTCPKCGQPLDKIEEEFNSLGTYVFTKNKFKALGFKDDVKLKCCKCGAVLPEDISSKLEDKLPSIVK